MQGKSFEADGVGLSYLDFGGSGAPLIALHAYWMEAGTWVGLGEAVSPDFHVYALDQRGHGHSDKPDALGWDDYIRDLEHFVAHLGLSEPVVLAGNSLGGTVAFRYAARHPERVRAMIVEESPAVEDVDVEFIRPWEGIFETREALQAAVGERFWWSVEPSAVQTDDGRWTLRFSPAQLADAQDGLNGDFWNDWLASDHPTLLLRGTESRAVDGKHLEEMARRRPNTQLANIDGGHVIHHDAPEAFASAVRGFLAKL